MRADVDLARLVTARICHDLGGGVAAVMTLLDLADEAGVLDEARAAARTLGARVKLLRAAWGEGEAMSPDALAALAAGAPAAGRITLDHQGLPPGMDLSAPVARAALNAVMLGGEALPHGGTIGFFPADGTTVAVRIEGPGAAWPAGLAAAIGGDAPDPGTLTPRTVLSVLAVLLARADGLRLSFLFADPAQPPMLLIAPAA